MAIVERLQFGEDKDYSSVESSIHLARYLLAKQYCRGKKVLDIACGEGYGSYVMAESWGAKEVYGVDISEEAIVKAKYNFQRENIVYNTIDAESANDQFEEGFFDLVVSFETIEHLSNPKKFLQNIRKWVKKDGIIIISCPNDHWYYPAEQGNPFHQQKYRFDEFCELCEDVLGSANKYLFGLPVKGFANVDVDNGILQTSGKGNLKTVNKFISSDTIMIPTTDDINSSNVSYFIGVWGNEDVIVENTTCYYGTTMEELRVVPYSSYVELGEKIDSYNVTYNEHIKYIGNLNDRVTELNKQIDILKKNLDDQINEKNEIEQLLQMTNKENDVLKRNFWDKPARVEKVEKIIIDDKKIKSLEMELESLFQSRSWKITSPLRRLFNFIRGK